MPDEDKWLPTQRDVSSHRHEFCDMYNGGGFVKGQVERGLMAFYCKWCLKIRIVEFNQSKYNLVPPPDDELNDPEDF